MERNKIKLPVSVPTTVYCNNCKSQMIIILYPGQMMPISDAHKRKCLVCNSDDLKTISS